MSEVDPAAKATALAERAKARSAERRAAVAEEKAAKAERANAERDKMREMMPEIAALVDALSERFGPVRVLAVRSGDYVRVNGAACARAGIDVKTF
ncbi:hypothetical protein ACQE3E_06575 [Methylomonas sp. MED-D]|uniref:hypothetical protein n=1 Tax=Methylomonas sp. MED-D TaxID=3418768 RepID=UPI003D0685BD